MAPRVLWLGQNWSRGPKLQKSQYLGGGFVVYLVSGPKSQLLET